MDGSSLSVALPCPRCLGPIPTTSTSIETHVCPLCGASITLRVFAAALSQPVISSDRQAIAQEATCFFHPLTVAAASCHRCGRFICNLCRISWPGEDLCPACVEAAINSPASRELESTRFHWDSLALSIAFFPSLLLSPTMVSAPLSLGLSLFTWRKPCSIVPRTKVRFVLAILIALIEITAWLALVLFFINQARAGRNR